VDFRQGPEKESAGRSLSWRSSEPTLEEKYEAEFRKLVMLRLRKAGEQFYIVLETFGGFQNMQKDCFEHWDKLFKFYAKIVDEMTSVENSLPKTSCVFRRTQELHDNTAAFPRRQEAMTFPLPHVQISECEGAVFVITANRQIMARARVSSAALGDSSRDLMVA
jgi:hypothetical protein